MSPEERSAKVAALNELIGFLKRPENKWLYDLFCQRVPVLRNIDLLKANDVILADAHEKALRYIQEIHPEHERSQATKEANGDIYRKLCKIAKMTRHKIISQDFFPNQLRKDLLDKLNYFLDRIRNETFSVSDYEDLFTQASLLEALLRPEKNSEFVECINAIKLKKLSIRGTPPKPDPMQTHDEQGGREVTSSGQSRRLTPAELKQIRDKFQKDFISDENTRSKKEPRQKHIEVELIIDKTLTDISGLLTNLLTSKLTWQTGKLFKSEYNSLLAKFNEIHSDKFREKILASLDPKYKGLPLKIMAENRIRYSLQQLNTDVQDLKRRATESAQKIAVPNNPKKQD